MPKDIVQYLTYVKDVFGDQVIVPLSALEDYKRQIQDCSRCELAGSRTHFVFGSGSPSSQILFVGEAPGEAEDLSGIPFVGRAGQLLDKMLAEIGLEREQVFIANVLKCRPPGNRDPRPDEISLCEPYLHKQIELISPRVIIALGRVAGKTLIKEDLSLSAMKGRKLSYQNVPLEVIYHPAAILRNMGRLDDYKADFHRLAQTYKLGTPAHE